jgi:hypothetical protein
MILIEYADLMFFSLKIEVIGISELDCCTWRLFPFFGRLLVIKSLKLSKYNFKYPSNIYFKVIGIDMIL